MITFGQYRDQCQCKSRVGLAGPVVTKIPNPEIRSVFGIDYRASISATFTIYLSEFFSWCWQTSGPGCECDHLFVTFLNMAESNEFVTLLEKHNLMQFQTVFAGKLCFKFVEICRLLFIHES